MQVHALFQAEMREACSFVETVLNFPQQNQ